MKHSIFLLSLLVLIVQVHGCYDARSVQACLSSCYSLDQCTLLLCRLHCSSYEICPEAFNRECEIYKQLNDCSDIDCTHPNTTGLIIGTGSGACHTNPCGSGGTCVETAASYFCVCPAGYYFNKNQGKCVATNLCDGKCTDSYCMIQQGGYHCECPDDGRWSEFEQKCIPNSCNSNPCPIGSVCEFDSDFGSICLCEQQGDVAACFANVCFPDSCPPGATCFESPSDYHPIQCLCPPENPQWYQIENVCGPKQFDATMTAHAVDQKFAGTQGIVYMTVLDADSDNATFTFSHAFNQDETKTTYTIVPETFGPLANVELIGSSSLTKDGIKLDRFTFYIPYDNKVMFWNRRWLTIDRPLIPFVVYEFEFIDSFNELDAITVTLFGSAASNSITGGLSYPTIGSKRWRFGATGVGTISCLTIYNQATTSLPKSVVTIYDPTAANPVQIQLKGTIVVGGQRKSCLTPAE